MIPLGEYAEYSLNATNFFNVFILGRRTISGTRGYEYLVSAKECNAFDFRVFTYEKSTLLKWNQANQWNITLRTVVLKDLLKVGERYLWVNESLLTQLDECYVAITQINKEIYGNV